MRSLLWGGARVASLAVTVARFLLLTSLLCGVYCVAELVSLARRCRVYWLATRMAPPRW